LQARFRDDVLSEVDRYLAMTARPTIADPVAEIVAQAVEGQ
jgi:hypothetical protein